MREMSPQEVDKYLQGTTNQPFLLDVREPWEYNICRIEGAQLIPMQSIPVHLSKLDPKQEIIVICHHGIRSRMVAQFLEQSQFENVINLSGGVNAWSQYVDLEMPRY